MMDMKVSFEAPGISLKDTQVKQVAKWIDGQHQEYSKNVLLVHRKVVFQILTFLIRICPVDTGRLRGSWTPFFDKYGNSSYLKWAQEAGLAKYPTLSPKKGFSQAAFSAGKSDGAFLDEPLRTAISTNVAYADYADNKVGFMARTITWGQSVYERTFAAFLDKAQEAGMIPKVDPNEESVQ